MSLTAVKMSEDVWLACLAHALTTETEEIMGLLLGDIQVCHYFNLLPIFLLLATHQVSNIARFVSALRTPLLGRFAGSISLGFLRQIAFRRSFGVVGGGSCTSDRHPYCSLGLFLEETQYTV